MGAATTTFDMHNSTPSPEPGATPPEYDFPRDKLKRRLDKGNKVPLVLVACGSFSPITELHLQMFELAQRHVERTDFEIVGNYMSPCSDTYGKSSLVPAHHRINMCSLAIEEKNANVMIDEWETLRRDSKGRPIYTRTVDVLRRLDNEINDVLGGIETADGKTVRAKIMLLIGADLALTMGDPKVWAPADIDVLLGYYGAFIIERPFQCDIQQAIEPLKKYQGNLWICESFQNDVSSTKARAQIRNGESALDVPRSVFEYIKRHHLYQAPPPKDTAPKDAPVNQTNGMAVERNLVSPVSSHR
ncbi:nicotinamide-nucleotide adenylyltransferase 2 [Paramyrothecium foliicola]|nr:nicotinamide-nucleotide adenylyltransferase 2 [Paramyrothecium foliicola]